MPTKNREYWKLKEEALDCTMWRNFGRGDRPVVRLWNELMNK
jgi:hypothetical protein